MKKILHISTGYSGTPLYKMLMEELLALGLNLHIFIPERNPTIIHQHWINHKNIQYSQPMVIKPYDRLLYFTKIYRIFRAINSKINSADIGLCHAHTLFTDGGVACMLYEKWQIPYVVALRNTDINLFFKYAFHLRKFGFKMLNNASQIVFTSEALKNYFFVQYAPGHLGKDLRKKSIVVPNGIAPEWQSDTVSPKAFPGNPLRICSVARVFNRNKNPFTTIDVVRQLNNAGIPSELHMAGTIKTPEKLQNIPFVKLYDPISSIDQMKSFYDQSDLFLLPSLTETFGLVYAEAMSRGLPVLYTRGQGFDGHFPDGEVGFAIAPTDVADIVAKVKQCLQDYPDRSRRCITNAKRFNWKDIAEKYHDIYQTFSCDQ